MSRLRRLVVQSLLVFALVVGIFDLHETAQAGIIPNGEKAVTVRREAISEENCSHNVKAHLFVRNSGLERQPNYVAGINGGFVYKGLFFGRIVYRRAAWNFCGSGFGQVWSDHGEIFRATPINGASYSANVRRFSAHCEYLNPAAYSASLNYVRHGIHIAIALVGDGIDDMKSGWISKSKLIFGGNGLSNCCDGSVSSFPIRADTNYYGYKSDEESKTSRNLFDPVISVFVSFAATLIGMPLYIYGVFRDRIGLIVIGQIISAFGMALFVSIIIIKYI